MLPCSDSSSCLTNISSREKTIFSSGCSEKNSCRLLPRLSSMSVSVAMEGEARSRSTCEMKPLLSSHRSAISSCVRFRCNRNRRSFSPIFTVPRSFARRLFTFTKPRMIVNGLEFLNAKAKNIKPQRRAIVNTFRQIICRKTAKSKKIKRCKRQTRRGRGALRRAAALKRENANFPRQRFVKKRRKSAFVRAPTFDSMRPLPAKSPAVRPAAAGGACASRRPRGSPQK